MPSDLLTSIEVAERFRVSPGTVLRWAKDGIIPYVRAGRTVRFYSDDVERLLTPVTEAAS